MGHILRRLGESNSAVSRVDESRCQSCKYDHDDLPIQDMIDHEAIYFMIYHGGTPQPEAIGHTKTRLQPETGASTMHRLQALTTGK